MYASYLAFVSFPYEERLQRMGLHALQRLRADLIIQEIQAILGSFGYESKLAFPPSDSTRP